MPIDQSAWRCTTPVCTINRCRLSMYCALIVAMRYALFALVTIDLDDSFGAQCCTEAASLSEVDKANP
jgi:hypothetical protein